MRRTLFVKDKSFYGMIINIAIPVVLQSLITIGVNMVDTMMLGAFGEYQLSGSALANEFITIFQIMCLGMGFGAAVLTAKYYGAKELDRFKKIVTIVFRLCFCVALVFSLVSLWIPGFIMGIFTGDRLIIDYGIKYFKVSAYTYLPMALSLITTAILRSSGEVRWPLITSAFIFFVNIFCNWVFIFGHLGAPRLEITGAALGTLIARIVEAAMILGFFLWKEKNIGYRIGDLFISCKSEARNYLVFCVPVIISDTLLGLGNSMVSVIIGHLGASFVAANAIVSQVMRMSTILTQGVSNSSSVITGQTLGRKEYDKAYDQGITFWILSILLGLLAGGIILGICPFILKQFAIEEATVKISKQLMLAVAIMVVFQSMQSVLTKGVLRGGGDTKFLMVADILFLWLLSIPLGYAAGFVWELSAFWIYVALKADWIVKSLWCSGRLIKGEWVKKFSA